MNTHFPRSVGSTHNGTVPKRIRRPNLSRPALQLQAELPHNLQRLWAFHRTTAQSLHTYKVIRHSQGILLPKAPPISSGPGCRTCKFVTVIVKCSRWSTKRVSSSPVYVLVRHWFRISLPHNNPLAIFQYARLFNGFQVSESFSPLIAGKRDTEF